VSKRLVKKQQMQWTPAGAHMLLQVRTPVLNDDWEATFRRWYPRFRLVQRRLAALRNLTGGRINTYPSSLLLTPCTPYSAR